jgi:tetratricopeptide (TPR) repeat protein
MQRLLSSTPIGEQPLVRARVLCCAGRFAEQWGEFAQSCSLLEQSYGIFKDLGDLTGMADALDYLGVTLRTIGDYAASCRCHEQSLSILRQLDNPWRQAIVARNLASAYALLGDYQAAELVIQEGLEVARQLDNTFLLALLMGKAGHIRRVVDQNEEAYLLLAESVALFRRAQDRTYLPFFLGELGLVACKLGDDLASASHLLESLHLHHEVRFSWGTTFSLICCTALLTAQGRIVPALHLVGAAVAARQASGAVVLPFEQTIIAEARAVAYQQLGEEATQEAWRQGEAMTINEAVALALATISHN